MNPLNFYHAVLLSIYTHNPKAKVTPHHTSANEIQEQIKSKKTHIATQSAKKIHIASKIHRVVNEYEIKYMNRKTQH